MALKAVTTKLEERQIKALKIVSEKTHIPQSELFREGVDFVIKKHEGDILSPEFKEQIESLLVEDRPVLKRLAKA